MKNKTVHDVLGSQMKCVNFSKCPMCYGCRNYRSTDPDCEACLADKKNNICNTDTHKTDLIAKFITKEKIKIEGQIIFKDNK